MLKAAFMFIAPDADPEQHKAVITTPVVELVAVGVKNYEAAIKTTHELVAQGIGAIELCGGFGIDGVAAVKKAAAGRAVIGVVRFDSHPGLENKSGDEMF